MKQESSNNLVMVEFYMSSKKMDLEDVYNRMGITEAKLRSSDTFKHKEFAADSWEFKLDYERSNDIGIQLEKTMQIVKSKLDEIKSIRREYNAECGFCVVINYKDPAELPHIYCKPDLVALAADIDAQIAIEIYKNHDEEYFKNYIPPEDDEVIDALVKARFYISAKEMNADQVSKRIGIPKDALDFEDGSVVEKTDLNSWSIETSYEESDATFFQVEKIVNTLIPKKEEITAVCREYGAKCGLFIEVEQRMEGFRPLIWFEPYMISFASDVGADIYIEYSAK